MDYLELQKKILTLAEHKVGKNCESNLLALLTELRGMSYRGEAWPLHSLKRLARLLEIHPASMLLAVVTGRRYQDFYDEENLPAAGEDGNVFIRKKIKEAGWNEPVSTVKDFLSLSHKLGKGIAYVFALLNDENYADLNKRVLEAVR